MFRNLCKIILAVVLCAGVVGCEPNQTVKNIWKDTKSYYREYLNTPATLELHGIQNYQDYMLRLGAGMAAIDEQLNQLTRVMDDSDRGPDNAWAMSLLRRFPWLSGLAVIDGYGNEMARVPEFSLKEFDASPLLEEDDKQRRTSLRAYVQDSPLGPEIYLGKPVYVSDELRAVVVAHFDMRALLAHYKFAAGMVVATPQVMLWPGVFDIDQTPVPTADWNSLVKSGVSGTISNKNGEFYWICSYFGNLPIIYALPSGGAFATRPDQLELLDHADAFAVPTLTSPPDPGYRDEPLGEYIDEEE